MTPITTLASARQERGATLVEFALALPLLLVIIAGVVDFGFTFQRYEVITNAAREGARLASLPGYTADDVKLRVRNFVAEGLGMASVSNTYGPMPLTGSPAGVEVTYPADGAADALTVSGQNIPSAVVKVTYSHQFLLLGPMLAMLNKTWGGTITLTATSQMRLEVEPATGP